MMTKWKKSEREREIKRKWIRRNKGAKDWLRKRAKKKKKNVEFKRRWQDVPNSYILLRREGPNCSPSEY